MEKKMEHEMETGGIQGFLIQGSGWAFHDAVVDHGLLIMLGAMCFL